MEGRDAVGMITVSTAKCRPNREIDASVFESLRVKFPAACGVQLVAVARRATVRRRACAGYLKYPAACGGVLHSELGNL
jgi:hypothetical protein